MPNLTFTELKKTLDPLCCERHTDIKHGRYQNSGHAYRRLNGNKNRSAKNYKGSENTRTY